MTAVAVLAAFYGLWLLFLASMNLERARQAGTLSRPARALGIPVVLLTAAVDVVVNLTLGTVLLLDRPRELTLSQRLSRLLAAPGWRSVVAAFVCTQLLDAFDPSGKHCRCHE